MTPPFAPRSLFAPQDWQRSDAERRAYIDLLAALGPLAPDPLFEMLWTLRMREIDTREPGRRAEVEGHVRAGIEAVPGLIDDVVSYQGLDDACRPGRDDVPRAVVHHGPGTAHWRVVSRTARHFIRDGLAADWELWPLVPHLLTEPSA